MVTENAELQQQLQSSEGEKQMVRQQLMRKEAELTRADETIRREQQQIQEMVSLMACFWILNTSLFVLYRERLSGDSSS